MSALRLYGDAFDGEDVFRDEFESPPGSPPTKVRKIVTVTTTVREEYVLEYQSDLDYYQQKKLEERETHRAIFEHLERAKEFEKTGISPIPIDEPSGDSEETKPAFDYPEVPEAED